MIEHLVLFRFKPETSLETQDRIVAELRALKPLIPGVLDLSAGRNFSARNQGYDYGLVVRLRDHDALAVYQDHPEHQRVVQQWVRPNLEQILAVDYEIT